MVESEVVVDVVVVVVDVVVVDVECEVVVVGFKDIEEDEFI